MNRFCILSRRWRSPMFAGFQIAQQYVRIGSTCELYSLRYREGCFTENDLIFHAHRREQRFTTDQVCFVNLSEEEKITPRSLNSVSVGSVSSPILY